jgi:hypothetical protein
VRLRVIQRSDRNRRPASHQTGVYWKNQTAASAPIADVAESDSFEPMSEYRDSSTLGGKIGCGMAAFVGVPLIGVVFIVSSLGDCAPDAECHRGLDWPLLGGAIAIAAAVGLGVRSLTNWIKGRRRDGS